MGHSSLFMIRIKEDIVDHLFVATLALQVVVTSLNHVVNVFAPGTPIDTIVCYALYGAFIILAIPVAVKRINYRLFAFFAVWIVLFIIAYLTPETTVYAKKYFSTVIFQMFPLLALGCTISDLSRIEEIIEKRLPFITIMCALYYISDYVRGIPFHQDNMAFAYWILPFTIFAILRCLKKGFSLRAVIMMLSLLVCQLLTGTRGPIVCIIAAILLFVLFSNTKTSVKIIIGLVGIVTTIYLLSDAFLETINNLFVKFSSIGFESRIISRLNEESFFDGNGRELIFSNLWENIMKKPIVGYGFLGDRGLIIGHGYPHNLFLELACQYGIILGCVLLIVLLCAAVKLLAKNKNNTIVIIIISCSVVKLFFSGTYVTEELLFVLFGLMINKCLDTSLVYRPEQREKYKGYDYMK